MSKHPKKRSAQRQPRQSVRLPSALLEELTEVDRLTERKRWREALEKLESLHQRYPNRPELLTELVNVSYELEDLRRYLLYCWPLSKLEPHDPEVQLGLAGAFMTNIYPALALQTFRRFLARFPDHARAAEIRQIVADLEQGLAESLVNLGVTGEDGLALAAQHDEVRAYLELGQSAQARQVAKQLLRRHPDFVPVINNLSLVDFMEGNPVQAIAAARRVLSLEPQNLQALGNLTRYLLFTGETAAARQLAEQLQAVPVDGLEKALKKVEALTYLGDDQGVLAIFRQAEQSGYLEPPLGSPYLYHLTAVAVMRLGDEAQARRYWQQTLKIDPHFSLAQANLADLDQPVYQRHAPWPFEMVQWVSQKARTDMIKLWQPAVQRGSDEAMTRATLRYLQLHPEMLTLVPLLLERGDSGGREFAINLASLAGTPELLAALRDFALSQHGPDELRHRALQIVSQAKLLPPGPTRLWLRGQWGEVILMGFEIYEEPVETDYPPQVGEWYRQAIEALHANDPITAERLLKQALAVRPDAPGLVNNLAATYGRLGRKAEAKALLRQNYQDHPDYFFGITGMAGLYVNEGKFEQAETLLKPLLSSPRLHITEFAALSMAHVQLYHAQKMPETAQTWLDMWAKVDPDNPTLHYWQRRMRQPQQPSPSNLLNWRKLFGR